MVNGNTSVKYIIFLLITCILFIISINAQERNYTVNTIAGKITVSSEPDKPDCIIKLNKKVIFRDPCSYSPSVLKHVKGKIAPFDEIIIFQNQMSGNFCSGMDIFFLGLKNNKQYKISNSIEYCGGPAPVVFVGKDKITITLPKFKSSAGQTWMPKEVWIIEKGKIQQLKQSKSRRKRT